MTLFRISPRWSVLLRRTRIGVAVWLLVMTAGITAIALKPGIFRAESKLYVRLGRENVTLDPTTNLGQGPLTILPQTRETEMNSVVEILKSRVLLERVADQITPARILQDQWSWSDWIASRGPEREAAVQKLGKMFSPASLRKSNLVLVSCDARNAELAKDATGVFVEQFLDYYRSLNRNPGARAFFQEQSDLLGAKLKACEEQITVLKGASGVLSLESQKKLLLEQVDGMTQDIRSVEAQIGELEAGVLMLRLQLQSLPCMVTSESLSGAPNLAADNIRDRYFALELRERELSAKYTAHHPLVRQVRDEIDGAREIYDREKGSRTQVTEGRSKCYEQAELTLQAKQTDLRAQQARLITRRGQLADLRREISELNRSEAKLVELERESDLLRESYIKYAQSLEQTRIDESLETDRITNISVVEPPIAGRKPVSPDRPLLAGMLTVAATFVAAAVALGSEALRSPRFLRRLNGRPRLERRVTA